MMKETICGILFVFMFNCVVSNAQIENLENSAYTFAIQPKAGTPSGHSLTGHKVEEVYGDLKSTLFLFSQGNNKFCLLTSPLRVEEGPLHDFCVEKLSHSLGISKSAVITNSSHNHTIPYIDVSENNRPDYPQSLCWDLGRDFIEGLENAVAHVIDNLTPVTVEWGVAEENRITYNRKGKYPDGTSFFMREEDRLALAGNGYHGVIDPEATVVLFKNYEGKPVSVLSFFTGHPVAAYNPEKLISFGQFPQVATEILSEYFGGIPVGFVQGCAGNINSKHMLTGTIEDANLLGKYLGESFLVAAKSLRPSKRSGLEWSRETVNIPFANLPDVEELEQDLNSIDDFIRRGNSGDENTLKCVGMNFPRALTPPYRAKLVELIRPWYVWALEQHKTGSLNNLPDFLTFNIIVARFGDVGFVGLPYEPFVETGLIIKKESDLPCVLTCGYTDGDYGYIPNGEGVDDREYMSSFYRYSAISYPTPIPPYKYPGGDACAEIAIKIISKYAR
ncbi:MAG: hypothetical protein ACOX2D_13455 [Fermentimonas sp.]|jgi:hypothetical protein